MKRWSWPTTRLPPIASAVPHRATWPGSVPSWMPTAWLTSTSKRRPSAEFGVFELALRQPGPRDQNLAAMVKANLVAGQSRTDALAELTRFREELASAGRDEDEDVVLEVMDYLTGWASPHLKL